MAKIAEEYAKISQMDEKLAPLYKKEEA